MTGAHAAPLICPVCGHDLQPRPGALACASGHSFDVAKEGYVNLLLPQGGGTIVGDVPEMLHARRRFLERGHFRPLADTLASDTRRELARTHAETPAPSAPACVLEVGSGEGFYIGTVAEQLADKDGAGTTFVGADVSKAAARLASKRYRDVTFIVADTNRGIWVRDGSVTVLLDVFAPRNPAEFARVLAPGGLALVVIPGEAHLSGAREALGLLGMQPDKERQVVERFAGRFTLAGRCELRYPIELSRSDAEDLAQMGPSYWHRPDEPIPLLAAPISSEAHFVLLHFRRAGGG